MILLSKWESSSVVLVNDKAEIITIPKVRIKAYIYKVILIYVTTNQQRSSSFTE